MVAVLGMQRRWGESYLFWLKVFSFWLGHTRSSCFDKLAYLAVLYPAAIYALLSSAPNY